MLINTISQMPVVARAAPVAAAATPEVATVARSSRSAPRHHDEPRIEPAEALAEAVTERKALEERVDHSGQPAFLAHAYPRRRELGWVLPRPHPPAYTEPEPTDTAGGGA